MPVAEIPDYTLEAAIQTSFAPVTRTYVGTAIVGVSAVVGYTVAWTELPFMRSADVTRGRMDQRGTFEPGRMTIQVNDQDGRYSPFNSSSPYTANAQDDFNDGVVNPMWAVSGDASVGKAETGGVFQFSLPNAAGTNYGFLNAVIQRDFSDGQVSIKATPPAGASKQFGLEVSTDTTHKYGMWAGDGGFMHIYYAEGGANADLGVLPYNAVQHRYWRIRRRKSVISWDTSPDGYTWLHIQTRTSPFNMGASWIGIYAGSWAAGAAETCSVDDFAFSAPSGLRPGRPIRLRMRYQSKDYLLFSGYIERVTPARPQSRDHTATIQAFDQLGLMARGLLDSTAFPQQTRAARVNAVLDLASGGVPVRTVSGAAALVPAGTLPPDISQLQHIQDLARLEDAQYWIAGDGRFVFTGRNGRFADAVSSTSQGVYGGAGQTGIQTFEADYSSDELTNKMTVTRTGGTPQTVTDSESITDLGNYAETLSSDLLPDDSEANRVANWRVNMFSRPFPRLKGLEVARDNTPARWSAMLDREINHRITVDARTPGQLGLLQDFWIDSIRHQIVWSPQYHHTVRWTLSLCRGDAWASVGYARVGYATVAP